MDKRKVIDAYRRGFLTLQECAQVLGVEKTHIIDLLDHTPNENQRGPLLDNQQATGN
ncbi:MULTISPECIES: hypothetical protein [Paenibacillus]|uniref:RNA polymerase subunit sigma-70 n=1 Tax=Paenibacillus vini TaxID=1476024 RepID=A0ABQ4M800_9BACL|nr:MULTISPECIES: hypothetical protein [Paenibacillus]MBQ4898472.1 hypothetical protein [Paenibacillus sp. Marseille-P2973]MDN4067498.1 hypothetical protein [Paenibacillus vini]GIP52114.1 hypothetical protein J42TS3_11490 [Paenibacillus vini]